MFKNFKEIKEYVKSFPRKKVGIVWAQHERFLSFAEEVDKAGLATPVLIGQKEEIEKLTRKEFSIIQAEEPEEASQIACALARNHEIDIIVKGGLSTSQLLKAVLDREKGLRTERILSDIFFYENPLKGKKRLVGLTDEGINILPTVKEKKLIIENAVESFRELECECPKVAMLSLVEKSSEKIQSTLDARELTKLNQRGEIKNCKVYGPLALDCAISEEFAKLKGIDSEVAGKADILIVPSVETGNILAKSIMFYCGTECGHIVVGARIPVLISSRAEDVSSKINSLVLAVAIRR